MIAPLLMAVVMGWAGAPRGEWIQVESPRGGYTVSVPGYPYVQRTRTEDPDLGPCFAGSLVVKRTSTEYSVGYLDEPVRPAGETVQKFLHRARNEYSGTRYCRLVSERGTTVDGYPALDFALAVSGGHAVRVRLVAVGNRRYQLVAFVPARLVSSPTVERFFASFRLRKRR